MDAALEKKAFDVLLLDIRQRSDVTDFFIICSGNSKVQVKAIVDSIVEKTYKATGTLYVCGNGGSASISNHLACDHGKLLSTGTELLPHIQSLSTNVEVITAIANDISYDDVFLLQVEYPRDRCK